MKFLNVYFRPVSIGTPFRTFSYVSGRGLDVEQITQDYQKHLAGLMPVETKVARVPIATTNSTDPIAAFNASFSVHDVLIRNGYKQQGKRYLHPNSTSKIAGVRILDGGKVYSDSNDILNDGKAHDAFDVFRLLECGADFKLALQWNPEITQDNRRAFYAS